MNKKYVILLLSILLFSLLIMKFSVVSKISALSYDSYYELRYSEHFKEKYLPMIYDDLSYGGRNSFFNLPYFIFIFILTLFMPTFLVLKYSSILLGVLGIFIIYKIVSNIFSDDLISLTITFMASTLPLIFTAYLNTFSVSFLFWIFFLIILFLFLKFENNSENNEWFLIFLILAILISPYSLLLIISFFLYFIFLKLENLNIKQRTIEVFIFTSLFSIWYYLVFFKSALSLNGLSVIWQNIPQGLIQNIYQRLDLVSFIVFIGFLPLILGIYGIYKLFVSKRKRIFLFITSISSVLLFSLFLGIIPFYDGLILLSTCFIILSSNGIYFILEYLKKFSFFNFRVLFIFLLILVSLFNFLPIFNSLNFLSNDSPNDDEIQTMEFLKNNVEDGEIILGDVIEGHFISSQSGKKNFYDTNFFTMNIADKRFQDSKTIFLSNSKVNILNLLNYYDINYIYISKNTNERYLGVDFLIRKDECFQKIFNTNTTEVYRKKC